MPRVSQIMKIRTSGYTFVISEPFQAGTIITAAEAKALNDLRAENIQNNTRRLVQQASAGLSQGQLLAQEVLDQIQTRITEYDLGYSFEQKAASARNRLGDIEAEARDIAREQVEEAMRQAGAGAPDEPEFQRLIAETAALPQIIAAARDRVAAKRRAVSGVLEDL